jgi:hypothetical protein
LNDVRAPVALLLDAALSIVIELAVNGDAHPPAIAFVRFVQTHPKAIAPRLFP